MKWQVDTWRVGAAALQVSLKLSAQFAMFSYKTL